MGQLGVVKRDQRGPQGGGVSGVEGGVPLAVFLAEADHHDVGAFDQGAGADGVHPRPFVVLPERPVLGAENLDAAIVAVPVVGDRSAQVHRKVRLLDADCDLLAPVGVDFPGKVDGPGLALHGVPLSKRYEVPIKPRFDQRRKPRRISR